ncbi:Diguanylate cyclase DosC [Vibrio aerogenes CECT 7868]|uniref:diguanylate cyclase n=1 Tax=Vibrio aerogenes CECT 7868 TaxID=1216006 RepID=A0A1M6DEJ9_9VIBR|nr:GGDEF domain-containing protein [Vibrio aerogenes]SHI71686.1 Diguanylate cyclase DosC [Vibrio aerogenes CECT 7868]
MTTGKKITARKYSLMLLAMTAGKYLNTITILLGIALLTVDITGSSLFSQIHPSLAATNPVAIVIALMLCMSHLFYQVKFHQPIFLLSVVLLAGLISFFDFGFNFFFHDKVITLTGFLLSQMADGQFDAIGNNMILTCMFYIVAVMLRLRQKYYAFQFFTLTGLAIPFTASLGYFFDAQQLYFQMSVSTVIICFMVALSGLGMTANKGAIKLFMTPNLVGTVARMQFLFSLSFCLIVGIALPHLSDQMDLLSAYELFVTLAAIFMSVLIYISTIILGKSEQKKRLAEKEMQRLLVTDPLTGLYNRRGLEYEIQKALNAQSRYGGDISILILDLDHFKSVNDNFGHDTGDLFLKTAAAVFKSEVRKHDIVSRYGGEEFLVLLPNTPEQEAKTTAERLRMALESKDFGILCGQPYRQTVSIGGTTIPASRPDISSSIKLADRMLYQAKNDGRNRSVIYQHCGK